MIFVIIMNRITFPLWQCLLGSSHRILVCSRVWGQSGAGARLRSVRKSINLRRCLVGWRYQVLRTSYPRARKIALIGLSVGRIDWLATVDLIGRSVGRSVELTGSLTRVLIWSVGRWLADPLVLVGRFGARVNHCQSSRISFWVVLLKSELIWCEMHRSVSKKRVLIYRVNWHIKPCFY